jgi:hypothetical protein
MVARRIPVHTRVRTHHHVLQVSLLYRNSKVNGKNTLNSLDFSWEQAVLMCAQRLAAMLDCAD